MKFKAKDIAHLSKGELLGNPDNEISGFSGIKEASSDDLTFIDDEKYLEALSNCEASVLLASPKISLTSEVTDRMSCIIVDNPRMALATLLWHYKKITENYSGISEHAQIDSSASIGEDTYIGSAIINKNTSIGANCEIHDGVLIDSSVTIGSNCRFLSGVRILKDTIIGNNCTIQPNAVIGSDGFGFVPNSENNYMKIPHVGNVVIEDHVEIGAGTCIDRGTMGSTVIKTGVKLDNLIQIAHNVEIGENTVIAAQTGIAGSAKIGKNCMIGGQVGIVGHIQIADEVKIAAQSGIGQSITEKGMVMQGSPAFAIRNYKMSYVGFRKLPDLMKQIDSLQKEINDLKTNK